MCSVCCLILVLLSAVYSTTTNKMEVKLKSVEDEESYVVCCVDAICCLMPLCFDFNPYSSWCVGGCAQRFQLLPPHMGSAEAPYCVLSHAA